MSKSMDCYHSKVGLDNGRYYWMCHRPQQVDGCEPKRCMDQNRNRICVSTGRDGFVLDKEVRK